MPKLKNRTPRMYRDRQWAFVKIDRKRISLGRWGSPEAKEKYDRLIAEWLENDRRLPVTSDVGDDDEPTLVVDICIAYTEYANKRYKSNEADNIRRALKHVRTLYRSLRVHAQVVLPADSAIVR